MFFPQNLYVSSFYSAFVWIQSGQTISYNINIFFCYKFHFLLNANTSIKTIRIYEETLLDKMSFYEIIFKSALIISYSMRISLKLYYLNIPLCKFLRFATKCLRANIILWLIISELRSLTPFDLSDFMKSALCI